jgi:inward rectifier potassium channel
LIFARFSRPRARFEFANNPVITRYEGQQTLIIRMAQCDLTSRRAAVDHSRGAHKRRRRDPALLRAKARPQRPSNIRPELEPFHVIDKDSPLHGLTKSDLTKSDALLVLNVGGIDDSSTQQLHARRVYSSRDIRWRHRYKDITGVSPQGRLLLDYTKFHDTVPSSRGYRSSQTSRVSGVLRHSGMRPLYSQKRTFTRRERHVRFVPIADIIAP